MIWDAVSTVLKVVLSGWLLLMAGAVVFLLFSGRMVISGLLRPRLGEPFSFNRLQMVAVTLLFAVAYVVDALGRPAASGMPDIPTLFLAPLIGSQAIYLGGKVLT